MNRTNKKYCKVDVWQIKEAAVSSLFSSQDIRKDSEIERYAIIHAGR